MCWGCMAEPHLFALVIDLPDSPPVLQGTAAQLDCQKEQLVFVTGDMTHPRCSVLNCCMFSYPSKELTHRGLGLEEVVQIDCVLRDINARQGLLQQQHPGHLHSSYFSSSSEPARHCTQQIQADCWLQHAASDLSGSSGLSKRRSCSCMASIAGLDGHHSGLKLKMQVRARHPHSKVDVSLDI